MIRERFLQLYPATSESSVAVREFLTSVCISHIKRGLADANFEAHVCSENYFRHWQGMSEALVSHELLEAGLDVRASHDGPDLLIHNGDQKIWVEVICPEPTGIPQDWLEDANGRAVTFPHEAILLRWTAAIKEKAEKLLGNKKQGIVGYLRSGVVAPDDAYVIAVNARLLRYCFASIDGISQYPFAVEATLSVGPLAIQINRTTLEAVGSGHTWRAKIRKPNGAQVPADTFFDPAFRPISAIMAVDLDGTAVIGNAKLMAMIYNPEAVVSVATRLLPAFFDYVTSPSGENEYVIERRMGKLSANSDR